MELTKQASADVTGLLAAWNGHVRQGRRASARATDPAAQDALLDAVYGDLRRLARSHLRRERRGHSLTPTALVHEAYLKLIAQTRVEWRNRAHFFGIAAGAMRRILVDHARARHAAKRGGACTVRLADVDAVPDAAAGAAPPAIDVLALDAALDRLAAIDPRQGRLVELRFFGGLTVEETAEVLGVARVTVMRDWALARAWLYRALRGGGV